MRDKTRGGAERPAKGTTAPTAAPQCLRCGFPVAPKPAGCKGPCPNCGFLYPLGDCAD